MLLPSDRFSKFVLTSSLGVGVGSVLGITAIIADAFPLAVAAGVFVGVAGVFSLFGGKPPKSLPVDDDPANHQPGSFGGKSADRPKLTPAHV